MTGPLVAMARRAAVAAPIAILVAWARGDGVGREPLFVGGIALSAFVLVSLLEWIGRHDRAAVASRASDDPFDGVHDRPTILLIFFFIAASHVLFFDVLWCGRTMVSAPYLNVRHDPGERGAGFGYDQDPWAGYLIEGPGLFITRDALRRGEAPLWNPREGAGSPHLANGETAALSLLQAPLNLFPSIRAWDFFAVCRFTLAGIFAAWWLWGLGLGNRSGLFGGLAFAYGGHAVLHANLVHWNTELFTPLLLFSLEALFVRRTLRRFVFAALVSGLALNGGNPQPAVVALLVFALRVLAGVRRTGLLPTLRGVGATALALGFGLALTAATLLPLADGLTKSVTRALLAPSGTAPFVSLLAWARPHGSPNLQEFVTTQPVLWYVGAASAFCALSGLALSLVERSRRMLLWALPALVLIASLYTPPGVYLFGEVVPVLKSINWPKYVGSFHLLAGAFAAFFIDRAAARSKFAARAGAFAGFAFLTAALLGKLGGSASLAQISAVIGVVGVAAAGRFAPLVFGVLRYAIVLVALIELALYRPNYPTREDALLPGKPAILDFLARETEKEATEEKTFWRTTAHGDLMPPLTSSLLGWHDMRSTTPMPLAEYHRFVEPWINCGVWPPYLILGASREALLSPALDLLGVRWIAIKDHRLLAEDVELPQTRFGALHRAVDFATFRCSGVRSLDAENGAFALENGASMTFEMRPMARALEIGLSADAAKGPFVVHVTIDGITRQIDNTAEALWTFAAPKARLRVEIRVPVAASPVSLTVSRWRADRFRPKKPSDFAYDAASGMVDPEKGVMVVRNKTALPVARLMRRVRPLESLADFHAVFDRFVTDGTSWDYRNELLLVREGAPLPEVDLSRAPSGAESVGLRWEGSNRLIASVAADAPAWLSIAVANDGAWTATENGVSIPIIRANGAFLAVPIAAAGSREIHFEYRPRAFVVGLWVSVTAIMLLLALGGLALAAPRRRRTSAPRSRR